MIYKHVIVREIKKPIQLSTFSMARFYISTTIAGGQTIQCPDPPLEISSHQFSLTQSIVGKVMEEEPFPGFENPEDAVRWVMERDERRRQQPSIATNHPPCPSFEDFRKAYQQPAMTPRTKDSLLWTLDGPLETAITGAADNLNATGLMPFFDLVTREWHPIAARSITQPRVSSITVHVWCLEDWETSWDELHCEHTTPDEPEDCMGSI